MLNDKQQTQYLDRIEQAINYRFRRFEFLRIAMTHRSAGRKNYERLEFLGDSILSFIVADLLVEKFPGLAEGPLTRMRAAMVRQSTLAKFAGRLGLQELLIMGSGEHKSGGHMRDSVLSDVFEALIGAIYRDSDLPTVQKVLLPILKTELVHVRPQMNKDAKSALQERLQKTRAALPVYRLISQTGDSHDLTFTVECLVEGLEEQCVSEGKSIKEAEQRAAQIALARLEYVLNE